MGEKSSTRIVVHRGRVLLIMIAATVGSGLFTLWARSVEFPRDEVAVVWSVLIALICGWVSLFLVATRLCYVRGFPDELRVYSFVPWRAVTRVRSDLQCLQLDVWDEEIEQKVRTPGAFGMKQTLKNNFRTFRFHGEGVDIRIQRGTSGVNSDAPERFEEWKASLR